jgi:hypothetical protein
MNTSALPHSLASGLPFRRFELPEGQKGREKFFSENPV